MPVFEGPKWMSSGGTTTITWSFATNNYSSLVNQFSGYTNFDNQVGESYKASVRAAFTSWQKVANVKFVEVTDSTATNIRIGDAFIDGQPAPGKGSTLAETKFWYSNGFFDTTQIYFDVDAYQSTTVFYQTALHEIGHAIGLGHSSSTANVMYFQNNSANAAGILTADDIAGVVQLYGAPQTVTVSLGPLTATQPAVALTAFLTGKAPTASEFTARTTFSDQQYTYYRDTLKVTTPEIGPYEALGLAFSDLGSFTTRYGTGVDTTTAAFVAHAYQDVFKRAPTAAQTTAFLNQVSYFKGLYQGVGQTATLAETHARGAVLGQMIGYVMTDATEAAQANHTLDNEVTTFLAGIGGGNTALYGSVWA